MFKAKQESIYKNRVVVDIRKLNKIIEIDNYSMSLQSDIILTVTKREYISVFDVVAFFYQWNVRVKNRSNLTIILYRDQKQFNVGKINFKKFSIYVQRQIDTILRNHKTYSKIFINDIVIYSKTLKEHVKHLHAILSLLGGFHISFNLIKFFLYYSLMQLLNQKVDAFEFTTIVEKIKIIIKLDFFKILRDFEIYFDLIE